MEDELTHKHALELTRRRFCVMTRLPDEAVDMALRRDNVMNEWVLQTVVHTYTHRHNSQIKYPRDWWQAFKARFFGWRLLKRFPVIYTEVDVWSEFPEFVPPPSLGPEVRFAK